jgi:outer membrane protein assembly factor BamB
MKSINSPVLSGSLVLALLAGLSCGQFGCACTKQATQPAAAKPEASVTKPQAPAAKIDFPLNHDDWSTLGYRLDWVGFPFRAGHDEPIVAAVSLGDAFVIQDKTSETALLDASTGQRRWGTSLANPLTKFVGATRDSLDASRILVSSESEGYLLASATGSLVGKTRYEKVVNTRPMMSGRLAIFGTSTGEIVGHLVEQNVKAWGFQTGGAIEATPVLMNNGEIGAVSQAGDVVFINAKGQLVGRNRILESVAMDPVTDGNSLFIGGLDQSIWAFNSNGGLIWRHRTAAKLSDQITLRDGVLYCNVPGEGLLALDAATGKVNWTAKKTSGVVIGFRNGRLLARTAAGVDMLDPATGSCTAQVALPGITRLVVEKMDDGVIYAVASNGNVARFLPR